MLVNKSILLFITIRSKIKIQKLSLNHSHRLTSHIGGWRDGGMDLLCFVLIWQQVFLSSAYKVAKAKCDNQHLSSNQVENINMYDMQIEYDREVPLGEGAFSFVFLGKYNGVKVAVKRVQQHNVNENEEKALQQLDHPNIVKLFYSELNADFKYDFLLNYDKKIRNDINKRNFLCFSGFSL